MKDYELLLLSWTQMTALEMLSPDEQTIQSKKQLEQQLKSHNIRDVQLLSRTIDIYKVAFVHNEEHQAIDFNADEVESIYDL